MEDQLVPPLVIILLFGSVALNVHVLREIRLLRHKNQILDKYLISTAMELERAKNRGMLDELTGLPNRHFLANQFRLLVRHREGVDTSKTGPVIVVMVDVDKLKRVNDVYGHQAGDEAIRVAAKHLQRALRSNDTVVRLGGDEFAAICERVPRGHVHDVRSTIERRLRVEGGKFADHVRDKLKELGINPDPQLPIGLSVGVVVVEHPENCTIDSLLQPADAAMYDDKNRKKGCRQGH